MEEKCDPPPKGKAGENGPFTIETTDLTKRFDQLTAVDSVSIKVNEGEIFGLLGPNGAGKTTLISMLVTMKKPNSGSAFVNGYDVTKNPGEVRNSIGIVFQDPSLDEELTAYENLELHAAMYGIEAKDRKREITSVIKIVDLEDRLNDVVKTFSGGMRRRLEIARGLLHCPKVLFLDEPTLGLDPQTRSSIWDAIRKMKKEKKVTIVLTTHYLEEADALCDRVAIIDHGKIVALDRSETLKNSLGGDIIIIESSDTARLETAFKTLPYAVGIKSLDGKITLKVSNGERKIPELLEVARKEGVEVKAVSLHKPTLDDVFLHYTGRAIREEGVSGKDSMKFRMRAFRARRN